MSCQRWGRHYDHGLYSWVWICRVHSQCKHGRQIDNSSLMVKDETDLRDGFDTQVRRRLAAIHCDKDEALAACLESLTKYVTAAAKETLPAKQHRPMRKRYVSDRTRQLYEQRRNDFEKLTDDERRAATRAIGVSCREDFRDYVDVFF